MHASSCSCLLCSRPQRARRPNRSNRSQKLKAPDTLKKATLCSRKEILLKPRKSIGKPSSIGQPENSLEPYRKAAELKPDDAAYQAALGYALYNSKDYDGAVEAYGKAVGVDVKSDALQKALQSALFAQEHKRRVSELEAKRKDEEANRKAAAAAAVAAQRARHSRRR